MVPINDHDALRLFELYMKITDVPRLKKKNVGDPRLTGKRLGIINGATWISLWTNYFGRLFLPEVSLVAVGNEGVQLNFMQAHEEGLSCPPQINIDLFAQYARDLVKLAKVDAILISCSTMNRSLLPVQEAVAEFGVPVLSIDQPMMERAVEQNGKVLLVATHGPTVENTRSLLFETAAKQSLTVESTGVTVEEAFDLLGKGQVDKHNEVIASAISSAMEREKIACVVLAQLSMGVFKLSYPDGEASFGVPVLTSAEEGFLEMRKILINQPLSGGDSK